MPAKNTKPTLNITYVSSKGVYRSETLRTNMEHSAPVKYAANRHRQPIAVFWPPPERSEIISTPAIDTPMNAHCRFVGRSLSTTAPSTAVSAGLIDDISPVNDVVVYFNP